MFKPIRVLIAVLAALAMTLVAGCGGSAKADEAFIGSWKLVSMETDGEVVDPSMLTMLEEMGMVFLLEFADDGNFSMSMGEEVIGGTWEAQDASTVTLKSDDGNITGKIEEGKLNLAQGEDAMSFEKQEAGKQEAGQQEAGKQEAEQKEQE